MVPSPAPEPVDNNRDPSWRRLKRRYAFSLSRWLGGPVFAKEVWTLGKRLSTNWVRFLYGGLLLGLLVIVMSDNWMRGSYGPNSGLQALQAYQRIAPIVTGAVLSFQFVMLPLMACVLGGSAICDEVRAGSLGTLLSTPLKAWQIVMGKLLGRCTELFILALIALPLLLMLRVLGGVTAESVIGPTVIAAANSLLALQIAMWMSARVKHGASAIGGAIAFVGIYWVVSFVALFVLIEALPWLKGVMPLWPLVTASPPASMMMNMTSFFGGGAPPFPFVHWLWHVLFILVLTAGFFFLTTRLLRRAMYATAIHGPGAGRTTKQRKADPRKAVMLSATESPTEQRSLASTTDAQAPDPTTASELAATRRKKKSTVVEGFSRTVGDHPVLWREFQQRMTRGVWAMPVGLGICICGLLFVYWMGSMQEPTQVVLAVGGAVLLMLLAALQTTSAISSEREGRTLEVLLSTPLTARAIVWGKLLGAAKRLAPFVGIITLHLVFSGIIPNVTRYIFFPLDTLARFLRFVHPTLIGNAGPEHLWDWSGNHRTWASSFVDPLAIGIFVIVLSSTLFFQLAAGVFLSGVMKRTTPASIASLMLALLLWAFIPIALAIVNNHFVQAYSAIHPVVLMSMALDEGTDKVLTAQNFGVPTNSTPFAGFLMFVCIYCLLAIGIGFTLLKLAALEIGFAGGRRR